MTLSRTEADDALELIQESADHSARLAVYERSANHLILWGGIWIAGFGVEFFKGPSWSWIWAILSPLGFVGSLVIARRSAGQSDWRSGVAVWTILLFVVAVLTVLGPPTAEQIGAVNGLTVAAVYVLAGLRVGMRLIAIGVFLAAATLLGYFYLAPWFLGWMALIGGGSLVLGGLWLRKV